MGRLCTDGNPWVKLGTAMLQRCPAEEKESTGNEILKICRSLYDTKHMLPAEVSFNVDCRGYESCFGVPVQDNVAMLYQAQWRASRMIRMPIHNT